MRRSLIALGGALLAVVACHDPSTGPARVSNAPSLAVGTGAHFLSTGAALDGANLVVSFREAGLGNGPVTTVHIVATADGSALYGCINGGGNHPQATNKELVNGPVIAEGDFAIGKNGSASGSLTINPPPSTLVCPAGQTHVLANVSYTNVTLTDETNGVTAAIDGTFAAVFITFR
jgi:hypothetical protein